MKTPKKPTKKEIQKNTNFNTNKKNHSMKTFEKFEELKRSEKAILIKTELEETQKEESFWLPLSKVEINENSLTILDGDIWEAKLQELTAPKEVEMIKVFSNVYDKGEKATKIGVNVKVPNQEEEKEFWVFIPNSQIQNVEKTEDKFKITLPKWLWTNSFLNSVQYQLDHFYNKDKTEELLKVDDFILLSSTSTD